MNEIVFLKSKMHSISMEETVSVIEESLNKGGVFQHVVVNVAKLVNMQKDKELFNSVQECDLINIDGQGVVLGARFCGHAIPERVAGVDLFYQLLALSEKEGYPIFLLGATDSVVQTTRINVLKEYPDLKVAGVHHGYFWDDEESVVNTIKSSGAKLLFVAITSPKKENFINKWKDKLGVNFVMGVGGTFDVVAGKVSRAPLWMQKYGLEWLYRVIQEPRRMFWRYFSTNIKFAFYILKDKFSSSN
ncbi:WecB/TagA/CpsF family glycosyltransferase [Psychrosphaera sp. B3R10]|uniref:WecB/TagA/CpsF family glycosyltransferase n=1 Tax=unclassified Psychrosphaera TaxID=2641570 RepID=UPI001C0A45E2|nr:MULTISPECIES: WecB/TagA/CpsF family glycosyltransferase [unclassified Psychrosphaera]MBU2881840.1 WecB/TagA/CpsF family glycosyltransferase [Psychrosphaera sp. I2R16]MBU2989188.1 WecB/TagA/CpsF family glycosyltransferase [Psychrosphaera sp. B3R10]MDO6719996.1 WecB/TagA/CpsF family glycosyltransferase [Psychrosphaera sp. 1_MG-2023]